MEIILNRMITRAPKPQSTSTVQKEIVAVAVNVANVENVTTIDEIQFNRILAIVRVCDTDAFHVEQFCTLKR